MFFWSHGRRWRVRSGSGWAIKDDQMEECSSTQNPRRHQTASWNSKHSRRQMDATFFFFFFSRTEEEAATTGGARLTLIPSFWGEGARDARSSDAANPARAPAAPTVAPTQGHVAHPGTGTQATTRSPSVQHPFFLFFF